MIRLVWVIGFSRKGGFASDIGATTPPSGQAQLQEAAFTNCDAMTHRPTFVDQRVNRLAQANM
jgi:hypothetical protein